MSIFTERHSQLKTREPLTFDSHNHTVRSHRCRIASSSAFNSHDLVWLMSDFYWCSWSLGAGASWTNTCKCDEFGIVLPPWNCGDTCCNTRQPVTGNTQALKDNRIDRAYRHTKQFHLDTLAFNSFLHHDQKQLVLVQGSTGDLTLKPPPPTPKVFAFAATIDWRLVSYVEEKQVVSSQFIVIHSA